MPRNIRVQARVTESEFEAIQSYCKSLGISISRATLEGIQLYIDVLQKERRGLRMVFVDANGYAAPGYNKNFDGVVKWQISQQTSGMSQSSPSGPARRLMES